MCWQLSVTPMHALKGLQNHARSVLHRDMNARATKHTKQEPAGPVQNEHAEPAASEKEPVKAKEAPDTVTSADLKPQDDALNLDQPEPLPDSNMAVDGAKPGGGNEMKTQEQTQDDQESGAQTINDEDLFGFDPSPLPTPQLTDLVMENMDSGVPLTTTESLNPANESQGAAVMNGSADDLDDLFGDDGTGTEAVDPNTSEQQDTDVNSLLPGLEFYANENNATPGGADGIGDLDKTGMGPLDLDELTGGATAFMMDNIGEGQTAMMGDSTFDDWLTGLDGGNGGQNGEGQANGEDAQFDANFFNLD